LCESMVIKSALQAGRKGTTRSLQGWISSEKYKKSIDLESNWLYRTCGCFFLWGIPMSSSESLLLIFLDIDEVLQTERYQHVMSQRKVKSKDELGRTKLDPLAVENLNWIIARTGAKIVVTASERKCFKYDLTLVRERLRIGGVRGEVIGLTGSSATGRRGEEIDEYLETLQSKPDAYCVIDDSVEGFDPHHLQVHVRPRTQRGLEREHALKAVWLLSRSKAAVPC
jgi:hypothetical protein